MISVEQCQHQDVWDGYVTAHGGHPLQLWGWGQVKSNHGWSADHVFVRRGGEILGAAQLLIKLLPGGFKTFVYVPRGPVVGDEHRQLVLDELARYAKKTYKAITLSVEPHWRSFAPTKGWRHAKNTILLPRTLILDLTKTEDELMAAISRKRRYDIRRATKDVSAIRRVTTQSELEQCLAVYRQTAERAHFALHDDQYYKDIFHNLGEHSLLTAAFNKEGRVIAFSWPIVSKDIAFELYGGSNEEGQKLMANYALKWWMIKTLKEKGIANYDLNGLLNDGVSHFKRSFSNHEDMLAGTYDKPLSVLYGAWAYGLPLIKRIVRMLKF